MARALALNGVLGSNEVEAIHAINLEVLARMSIDHKNLDAATEYLARALATTKK